MPIIFSPRRYADCVSEVRMLTRESCRGRGLTPLQDAERHIHLGRDKDTVLSKYIDETKGRGVFAKDFIGKGSFIIEYHGALHEENEFNKISNPYTYYFKHNGKDYCIDASHDDGSLGRLVNDDKKPNAKMLKIEVNGNPHLCLFAIKNISEGQEITYDYGGADLPWRVNKRTHSKVIRIIL
ncbi:probable histone-lysine N-methyltransferase set-1 [Sinocyclocheilus grahami]|uniref:probable histone-lysine N-methyltransferase set-1 n=1 Tax=Sinocyclocheilus grahami TaxID=75366 RepID=UPI0007AD2F40|nr:PREDICTED: probable histone-lysine N-methyltransferase set-1 [Sinocyclocheilus grahami]